MTDDERELLVLAARAAKLALDRTITPEHEDVSRDLGIALFAFAGIDDADS